MIFRGITGFALATLLMLSGAWAQAPDLSTMDVVLKSVPDGPVAVVNGEPIPARVFRDLYMGEMMRWAVAQGTSNVPDDERLGIAINSLRVLIEREVLYQEAVRRKISISDADLQAKWKTEFDDLKTRVSKQGEAPLSDDAVLARAGTTREEAQAELRKAMMVDAVRDALIRENGVTVSDAEVTKWFDANKNLTRRPDMLHLKQIFFSATRNSTPKQREEAKKKAADALARIRSGQSFEGIARDLSEGQYKDKGTMMPASEFPEFIRNTVATMKPEQVSDVVESEAGYHIIKLVEMIPGQEGSFEEAAPRIKEMLTAQKGARVISEFCGAITGDPEKVRVYLDLEKQLQLRPDLVRKLSKETDDKLPPSRPETGKSGGRKKD